MKILILCDSGTAASFLETPMRDYIKDNNLSGTLDAMPLASLNQNSINSYDVVVLAPQIAFNLENLEKTYPKTIFYKISGTLYIRLMRKKVVTLWNRKTPSAQEEFWNILSEILKQ